MAVKYFRLHFAGVKGKHKVRAHRVSRKKHEREMRAHKRRLAKLRRERRRRHHKHYHRKYNAFRFINIRGKYAHVKHVHGKWYGQSTGSKKYKHYRRISKKKAARAFLSFKVQKLSHIRGAKFYHAQAKAVLGAKKPVLPHANLSNIKAKQAQNEEQLQ